MRLILLLGVASTACVPAPDKYPKVDGHNGSYDGSPENELDTVRPDGPEEPADSESVDALRDPTESFEAIEVIDSAVDADSHEVVQIALCQPCPREPCPQENARCAAVGDDTESSCTIPCALDVDCPLGFRCLIHDASSEPLCLPTTNTCDCFTGKDGKQRPCQVQNEWGTCYGHETCDGDKGWDDCTAKAPADETCDGSDNDCDGLTDEGLVPTEPCQISNTFGTCSGKEECAGAADWRCNAREPAPDTCNDVDDDCDGSTDGAFTAKGANCDGLDDDHCETGVYVCSEDGASLICEGDDEHFVETCDGSDNDCDGLTDEGFQNRDGDEYADCIDADRDGDGQTNDEDCAPDNPAIHADAEETCNGVDDDCDDQTDEGYANLDGDKHADCVDPDDDGDGKSDDVDNCPSTPNPAQANLDQDAYGDACDDDIDGDEDPNETDCAPNDASRYVGADEACNEVDDDCDGATDEEDARDCALYYLDQDQDTFGQTEQARCLCGPDGSFSTLMGGDCDDTPDGAGALVHPAAKEICSNGIDDNCNGSQNDVDAISCATYFRDHDQDGAGIDDVRCLCTPDGEHTALESGDCDDGDASVHPGQTEVCLNDKDDDCDGSQNDEDALGITTFYWDEDADGWGLTTKTKRLCVAEDPYRATRGGDCDDTLPYVNPGSAERCATLDVDDDCDEQTDEEGAQGCRTYFLDTDHDDYGVSGATRCLCIPSGYYRAEEGDDCNDDEPAIHPLANEACNGADDDCDGSTDENPSALCSLAWKSCDAGSCTAIRIEVPAGDCWMGCNDIQPSDAYDNLCNASEKPGHLVTTGAYEVDVVEVTNTQFAAFLTYLAQNQGTPNTCNTEWGTSICADLAGSSIRIHENTDGEETTYAIDTSYENHPVTNVRWYGAYAYCKWAGKHLCSESQWEKAARGGCEFASDPAQCTKTTRIYPWEALTLPSDCTLANFKGGTPDCPQATQDVGSHPEGASVYGALDMAGNVAEWVFDWFHDDYDLDNDGTVDSPTDSGLPWPWPPPAGGSISDKHIIRNGAYSNTGHLIRTSSRTAQPATGSYDTVGFRCCLGEW